MLVAITLWMQNKGLDRKIKFHYKKFKSTFLILSFLFSMFGCGNGNISNSGSSDLDGSINLLWDAPNTNTNGTKLTDLVGYIVYYKKKTTTDYTYTIDVGNSPFITIKDLSLGTWCFAVTAYNDVGNESDYSNEICTDI